MNYINPAMEAGVFVSVQTPATGANWATFGAITAKQLIIINSTGASIDVTDAANVAAGVYAGNNYATVADGAMLPIFGLANASQIAVRRNDQSATQVYVKARAEY